MRRKNFTFGDISSLNKVSPRIVEVVYEAREIAMARVDIRLPVSIDRGNTELAVGDRRIEFFSSLGVEMGG